MRRRFINVLPIACPTAFSTKACPPRKRSGKLDHLSNAGDRSLNPDFMHSRHKAAQAPSLAATMRLWKSNCMS